MVFFIFVSLSFAKLNRSLTLDVPKLVGLFLANLAVLHADFNPADISAFVHYNPDHHAGLPGGTDRIEETSG
jgi:hypothetical protein